MAAPPITGTLPRIRVNGAEIDLVRELLQSLEIREGEGGLTNLELRLSRQDSRPGKDARLAFDDNTLDFGQEIQVWLGDQNAPWEVFGGTITAIEGCYPEDGAPELTVLAEDALQRARMRRRTRLWENKTLAAIAEEIAQDVGAQPKVSGLSDSIAPQMQLNETDLGFLRRLCRRYDADLQISGKELHVTPRKDAKRDAVTLILHEDLRSARVIADLAHQATQVTVAGWNPQNGSRVSATSRGANSGPGGGATGAETLDRAIGARSRHVGNLMVTTQDEARATAESWFDQHARSFVTVHGVAAAKPGIRVGAVVTLVGLGNRFDNSYYVAEACHRFSLRDGYRIEFRAESAFAGRV